MNKKMIRNKIGREINDTRSRHTGYVKGRNDASKYAQSLIDQLEVLSPDWIKDNQLICTSGHGIDYYVPSDKLYGLLVPKQEEPEKVVVPAFVGEWYEEWKNDLTQGLFNLITAINYKSIGDNSERMAEWIKDPENDAVNILARMEDGYTVEKEKKYRIKLGNVYFKRAFEFTAWKDKAWVFSEIAEAKEEAEQLGGIVEEVSE